MPALDGFIKEQKMRRSMRNRFINSSVIPVSLIMLLAASTAAAVYAAANATSTTEVFQCKTDKGSASVRQGWSFTALELRNRDKTLHYSSQGIQSEIQANSMAKQFCAGALTMPLELEFEDQSSRFGRYECNGHDDRGAQVVGQPDGFHLTLSDGTRSFGKYNYPQSRKIAYEFCASG
jgi:hypothetical protein